MSPRNNIRGRAVRQQGNFKVVLAEDVDEFREDVKNWLEEAGYFVQAFPDGREAMKAILDGGIHLVISDYQMPNLDGLSLLRQVRDKEIPVSFVLMSGAKQTDSRRDLREVCKELGVTFVPKVFDQGLLRDSILSVAEDVFQRVLRKEDGCGTLSVG